MGNLEWPLAAPLVVVAGGSGSKTGIMSRAKRTGTENVRGDVREGPRENAVGTNVHQRISPAQSATQAAASRRRRDHSAEGELAHAECVLRERRGFQPHVAGGPLTWSIHMAEGVIVVAWKTSAGCSLVTQFVNGGG